MKSLFALAVLLSLSMFACGNVRAGLVVEDFSGPAKFSNSGANGSLGTGGAGVSYNFGTWLYSSGNGGVDDASTGDGSGSSAGNRISTSGQARAQAGRGTNARAVSVVYDGSLFSDGVEYTVSFDVIGDASGANAGRYWLAELYGFDNSGSNFIQIDGTHGGWGAGQKPFVANGSATVNFIQDSASNGVLLSGENTAGTSTTSFNFTYDGTNAADIAFSAGTFNNIYAIDNFSIAAVAVPEPASCALFAIAAVPLLVRRRKS